MTAHHENKKGLNPAQIQAPTAQHDNAAKCSTAAERQPPKRRKNNSEHPTDVEAVGLLLLQRPEGTTPWEAMNCTIGPGGRNIPSQLERELGIALDRDSLNNTIKKRKHVKWRIRCRADAGKVAGRVNLERVTRNAPPLSPEEVERLVSQFPDYPKTAA